MMVERLSRNVNSTGSSMVTMLRGAVALIWSIMAARVVNFPEPVAPVTSTKPRLSSLNIIAAITKGSSGSVIVSNGSVTEINSQKVDKVIDTTGAGDLFAAGFLHGYVNKFSIKESLQKGTEMSSKVIQQIGARL